MGLSDEAQRALIARAQQAKSERERHAALRELLEDFTLPAKAVIRRTLISSGQADDDRVADVLQTAALRFVATGLAAYAGQAAPRTYFLRIVINAAVDALRAADRPGAAPRPGEQIEQAQVQAQTADAERALDEHEQRLAASAALRHCLGRLGEHYREAIDLYYLTQRGSCAICAKLVGVTPTAFMQRISRARGQLAECITRWLGRAERSSGPTSS